MGCSTGGGGYSCTPVAIPAFLHYKQMCWVLRQQRLCAGRGTVALQSGERVKHYFGILYQCFAGLAVVTVDAYKHWIFHKLKTEY